MDRSYVYVPYSITHNDNTLKPDIHQEVSSPSSSSSASSIVSFDQPRKRRQHIGYACDRCRERRIGCDRGKPSCGQCKERYECSYSNHSLRLDNSTLRQRLEEVETTVGQMSSVLARMEQQFFETVPYYRSLASTTIAQPVLPESLFVPMEAQQTVVSPPYIHQQEQQHDLMSSVHNTNNHHNQQQQQEQYPDENKENNTSISSSNNTSILDWAVKAGWWATKNASGITSVYTNITKFEHLGEVLKKTVQYVTNSSNNIDESPSSSSYVIWETGSSSSSHSPSSFPALPMSSPSSSSSHSNFMMTAAASASASTAMGYNQPKMAPDPVSFNISSVNNKYDGVFDSLNRYASKSTSTNEDEPSTLFNTERLLEKDIKTRIICQHHKCGFPTLVKPARFVDHFLQDSLKPLVLSSVFSHSVPHCCIYHPKLVQLENDGRELGSKFYNYSHDLLGMDEVATISNIHQRTFLITYDLDLGRVRRAFLHLGIAIRMCFMLDLHRPEGYLDCENEFDREQRKRVFWTVWFYDTVIPHFFKDQVSTMRTNQISIEHPLILPDFDPLETDQTIFAISLIHIRKLAVTLSEQSKKMNPKSLVGKFRHVLWEFYSDLPIQARFGKKISDLESASFWQRRTYFCVLLDYCQSWITLYRPLLPASSSPPSHTEYEAILRTSQAAVAAIQLFEQWFQISSQSEDGFDCFFRPYLYHFMNIKSIFSANVSESGRPQPLVYISRAYLVLLLKLYQSTPTRISVEESQLEKDLIQILNKYNISINEVAYPKLIEEAIMDNPSADGGLTIFSTHYERGDTESATSGNLDLGYF